MVNTIQIAAKYCADGKLVAFPTETVYGLGADATNDKAVAAIFMAKNRPEFNPLIIHVADFNMAEKYGIFNDQAKILANKFWPGPLTLVVPKVQSSNLSLLTTAGLPHVGIRIPNNSIARNFITAVGRPIAAPSANPSGMLSPTEAMHVESGLGDKVSFIIDGGKCNVGVESTIIACIDGEPVLLRYGGIDEQEISKALHIEINKNIHSKKIMSPGQLASHYAPKTPIRLNINEVLDGEVLLAFGPKVIENSSFCLNLSPSSNLYEAAANLFSYLHKLDSHKAKSIAVMSIPDNGLGKAINDRLRRASL